MIVLSGSEKHETVHIRDSSVSDETNHYKMCYLYLRPHNDFVWWSLFITLTFTSSVVSLKWHVFKTMNEELNFQVLQYLINAVHMGSMIFASLMGLIPKFESVLFPYVFVIETELYFIMFYNYSKTLLQAELVVETLYGNFLLYS